MAGKKPIASLDSLGDAKQKQKAAAVDTADEARRGSVQTVRMDLETLKALQYARIERGVSQNDIMLTAIRKDLGLE